MHGTGILPGRWQTAQLTTFSKTRAAVKAQFGPLGAGEEDQGGVSLLDDGMPGLGGKGRKWQVCLTTWRGWLVFPSVFQFVDCKPRSSLELQIVL